MVWITGGVVSRPRTWELVGFSVTSEKPEEPTVHLLLMERCVKSGLAASYAQEELAVSR
jgi:hypothetical protein